jgi:hypothetical protein
MSEENKQQNTEAMQYDTVLATGRGNIIANEKDPLLREIWAAGYTHVEEDIVSWKMRLINKHRKYIKEICLHEYRGVVMQLTYRKGSNLAGSTHTWITESDGSAGKFRKLIEPCC